MAPIPSKIVYSLDPGTSPTPTPTITITPTPSVTPTLTPTKTPFPTPLPNFGNECGHLTVFEMGVSCVVVNPSTSSSNDGAASLEISGGTPPYTVIWENGNIAPAIGNLAAGEYDATVFDYYGDYSAKTTCVLVAPVPGSPTPTPTPTPTPLPSVFCMLVKYSYGETKGSFGKGEDVSVQKIVSFNREFSPSTNINGQPSWLSDDLNYLIYWNNTTPPGYWSLSGSSTTNYATSLAKLTNNNPLNPFTSGDWQLLGGFNLVCNITLGPCTSPTFGLTPFSISNPDIELFVVKSDTKCGCDGSIFINASGGNVPYQFSVDGGVTYKNFPLFDNLCFGNYTVGVLDASGYTKTTQITLNEPQLPITYYANLITTNETVVDNGITLTKTYRSTLNITPPLPDTVTLTFDVVHSNNFQSSISPTTSQFTSNTVLEVDTIPINYSYSSSTTGTTINTRNGCQNQLIYTTGTSLVWQAISYTSSNELIINTTTSVNKNFTSGCDIGDFDDRISIINLRINGCSCCNVQNTTV